MAVRARRLLSTFALFGLVALLAGPWAAAASVPRGAAAPGPSTVAPAARPGFVVHPLGLPPSALAFDNATQLLFATQSAWNSVVALNPSTFAVVANLTVGISPGALAVDSAAGELFVANNGSANVSVVNEATLRVVGSVPVGHDPTGIAFDAADDTIFVANFGSSNLTAFNATTWASRGSVATLTHPYGVSADAGLVWVSLLGHATIAEVQGSSRTTVQTFSVGKVPMAIAADPTGAAVLNHAGGTLTSVALGPYTPSKTTVAVGALPDGLAFDPSTGLTYVSDSGAGELTVLNRTQVLAEVAVPFAPGPVVSTGGGQLVVGGAGVGGLVSVPAGSGVAVAAVPVGRTPSAVAVDPSGDSTLVANLAPGTVTVLSPDRTELFTLGGVPGADALAADPGNGTVYAAEGAGNAIVPLELATASVGPAVLAGPAPSGIAFAAAPGIAYVASATAGTVREVNVSSGATLATTSVGSSPRAVASDLGRDLIYVANAGSNSVTVLYGQNATVAATIPVGHDPMALAVDPTNGRLFVANARSGNVTVVAAGRAIASVAVGGDPVGVAFDPSNGLIYVADNASDNLTGFSAGTDGAASSTVLEAPSALAFDPARGVLESVSYATGNLTYVGAARAFVERELPLPVPLDAFAYQPYDGELAVGQGAVLDLLNASTGSLVNEVNLVPTSAYPCLTYYCTVNSLAVDPVGGRTYVSLPWIDQVAVVSNPAAAFQTVFGISGMPYGSGVGFDARAGTLLVANSSYHYTNGQGWVTNYGVEELNASAGTPVASAAVLSAVASFAPNAATGDFWGIGSGGGEAFLFNGSTGSLVLNVSLPYGTTWDNSVADLGASGTANDDLYLLLGNSLLHVDATNGTVASVLAVGDDPSNLTYDPVLGAYLVANAGSDNLSVVDATTGRVTGSIPLPGSPSDLAFAPGTGSVFVAFPSLDGYGRINARTGAMQGFVRISQDPQTIATVGPGSGSPTSPPEEELVVPMSETVQPISSLCLPQSCARETPAYTRGALASSAAAAGACVPVIDEASGRLAFPSSNWIPTCQLYAPYVGRYGRTHYHVYSTWNLGAKPGGLVYDPYVAGLFAARGASRQVEEFVQTSPGSFAFGPNFTIPSAPGALGIDPSNHRLYVAEPGASTVAVLDTTTGVVLANLSVGKDPTALAYDAPLQQMAVASAGSGTVEFLSGVTNTVASTVAVPSAPEALAYDAATGGMIVACSGGTLAEILGGAVVAELDLGGPFGGLAYDATTGDLWVANDGTSSVEIVSFG